MVDQAVAGMIGALFAALLALAVAKGYTARHEREVRDEAAAQEFYRAYGAFFGAWKAWDDVRGRGEMPQWLKSGNHAQYLTRVAEAEGMLESFVVRLTLERGLTACDLHRLWCFRHGYKEVRYRVRRCDHVPWRRTEPQHGQSDAGYRQYTAFKQLSVAVARMIAERSRLDHRGWRRRRPSSWLREVLRRVRRGQARDERPAFLVAVDNLAVVTGKKDAIWDCYGPDLRDHYPEELRVAYEQRLSAYKRRKAEGKATQSKPRPDDAPPSRVLWWLVAEHLGTSRSCVTRGQAVTEPE